MANQRIYYAITAVGIAPLGSNTYTAVKGVQSIGISTKINLEQAFELGQLNVFQNIENIPDIEVTLEKVMDGNAPLYTLLTQGASDATLVGRSNQRGSLAFNIYGDTQLSASGVPQAQCVISGLYCSNISYTFPVQGNCVEQLTAVGNNKNWLSSGFTFSPTFANTDTPLAPEGIDRRQNIYISSGLYPNEIAGISGNTNPLLPGGQFYQCKFQSIKVSANLGRQTLLELGHKPAYFRYVDFPVEIRTDFEIQAVQAEGFSATELGTLSNFNNSADQPIKIQLAEGLKLNLGTQNRITDVRISGANAGARGNNQTITYSYQGWNNLTIQHPADPSGL